MKAPYLCKMARTIFMLVLLGLVVLIEFYTFYGLKDAFRPGTSLKIARAVHLGSVALSLTTIAVVFLTMRQGLNTPGLFRNWMMGLMVTFFVTKLTFALVLGIDDMVRGFQFLSGKAMGLVAGGGQTEVPGRRRFLAQAGLVLAAIPFSGFLYGILRGRYDYQVHRIKLAFPDLPAAFVGYKIVQISDIHAGSFDNTDAVQRGLDMVQAEAGDLILFTGDLVNNLASEATPYLEMFAKLEAPDGKYSVLGNHDYGHYAPWDSETDRLANHEAVRQNHVKMGFTLLNNSHVELQKEGDRICVAGVENWGLPPFPQYGDLRKALLDVPADRFTVLMSHDPAHWDAQIKAFPKHVHLTLSGHTHGFQMGVEIPGWKWSPVQLRYKQWAGHYQDEARHLYVNRGFGFIGFPGRVGIWPEITVIELTKA